MKKEKIIRNNLIIAVVATIFTITSCIPAWAEDTLDETGNNTPDIPASTEQSETNYDEDTIYEEQLTEDNTDIEFDSSDTETDVINDDLQSESQLEQLVALSASNISIENNIDGLLLNWKASTNSSGDKAIGYMIARQLENEEWQLLMDKEGCVPLTTSFTYFKDTPTAPGLAKYAIIPYYTNEYIDVVIISNQYIIDQATFDNNSAVYYWMKKPKSVSITKNDTDATITWSASTGATGYEVQYCTNPIFIGSKTYSVDNVVSIDLTGLPSTTKNYARVRAYHKAEDKTYYSAWTTSLASNYEQSVSLSQIKFNGSNTNLYSAAGESIGTSGYSVMQGGCTDGTYLYYLLEKSSLYYCKVVKVRISDGKVMTKSAALNLGHGNSMTYNSKTNELVIAQNKPDHTKISRVNASTLKLIKTISLKPPKTLFGIGCNKDSISTRLKGTDGYISIHYIPSKNQYALQTRGDYSEIMMVDANFTPLYMITLSKKKPSDYFYQNIVLTDNYILSLQSGNANGGSTYTSCPNYIYVYDFTGAYQGKVKISSKYEIENMAIKGSKVYFGFHTSATTANYKHVWKYWKKVKRTAANKKRYTVKNKYKVKKKGSKYKVYRYVKVKTGSSFKRFGKVFMLK